jgi:2-hydroxy-6-oxo-octa-2,4-dienoate hydrolase
VGNSFGGTVALGVASLHPDRVAALVLLGVPAGDYPLTRGMLTGRLYEPGLDNMAAALRMFPHDPTIVTPEMIRSRYEMSVRPDAQQAVHSLMPEPPSVGSVIKGFPEGALRKISTPAMILHGRDDPVVPLDCSLTLHRCLERSELHSFGRCGHWVQLERRATFVELVVKAAVETADEEQ